MSTDPGRARELRESGEISRESYWTTVSKGLTRFRDYQPLLRRSGSQLLLTEDELFLRYPLENGPLLTLLLDPTDIRAIGMSVVTEGRYEPSLSNLLLLLAQTSRVFLDVGANSGFHSISAALMSKTLRVHAFEPNPLVFEILNRNIDLNLYPLRVVAHNFGLSSHREVAVLHVRKFTGSGGGSLRNLHPEEGKPRTLKVELCDLDSTWTEIAGNRE
jgi:FkbM family methyltransferase